MTDPTPSLAESFYEHLPTISPINGVVLVKDRNLFIHKWSGETGINSSRTSDSPVTGGQGTRFLLQDSGGITALLPGEYEQGFVLITAKSDTPESGVLQVSRAVRSIYTFFVLSIRSFFEVTNDLIHTISIVTLPSFSGEDQNGNPRFNFSVSAFHNPAF